MQKVFVWVDFSIKNELIMHLLWKNVRLHRYSSIFKTWLSHCTSSARRSTRNLAWDPNSANVAQATSARAKLQLGWVYSVLASLSTVRESLGNWRFSFVGRRKLRTATVHVLRARLVVPSANSCSLERLLSTEHDLSICTQQHNFNLEVVIDQ